MIRQKVRPCRRNSKILYFISHSLNNILWSLNLFLTYCRFVLVRIRFTLTYHSGLPRKGLQAAASMVNFNERRCGRLRIDLVLQKRGDVFNEDADRGGIVE